MSLQILIENELDPYLIEIDEGTHYPCLLYTSPSPRD